MNSRDEPDVVKVGGLSLEKSNDAIHSINYDIDKIIIHPDYIPSKRYNDIALLKLQYEILFSKTVRPACLPFNNDENSNKKVTATGWGRESHDGETSKTLLKVKLDIIAKEECNLYIKPEKRRLANGVIDTQICAGILAGGKDTCQVI